MKILLLLLCTLLIAEGNARNNQPQQARTILAVGAHAGDMEVSCGAVLAKHTMNGDRVVMLHLTLGEGGNPALTPEKYGEQKRREAEAAAKILGAEVIFGPYKDGEIPSLEGVESEYPRHRGLRGVYFTENWEDMEGYTPYISRTRSRCISPCYVCSNVYHQ